MSINLRLMIAALSSANGMGQVYYLERVFTEALKFEPLHTRQVAQRLWNEAYKRIEARLVA